MLTLLIGPAGSGKTGRVLQEIRRNAERNAGKQTLIVPDQYSHEAERELSRSCGDGIGLHAEVLSFTRLCSRVLTETGGCSGEALDGGGRLLVMYRALQAAGPALQLFGSGVRGTDFLQSLLETYDEFRSCHIGSGTLLEMSERAEGTLARKLGDLSVVFAAYEAAIPKGMYDPADRLDILSGKIRESSFGSEGAVWVDGFVDFTPQEQEVLRALLRKNTSLTVTVPCAGQDGIEPEFELPRRTLRLLKRLAEEQGTEVRCVELEADRDGRPAGLRRFCENLFLPLDDQTSDADGSVKVFSASSRAEECEIAAAEILRLVRGGCRWREIAVVARGWGDYWPEAVSILEKYGIPVQDTEKRSVMERPLLTFVTGLLDIIESGWDYESVFRCLKTGFVTSDREALDRLENYVLKWGIRGSGYWTRRERWDRDPEGFEESERREERLAGINDLRERFALPVNRLENALRREETARGKAEALWNCLSELGTDRAVDARAVSLREEGNLRLSAEYLQLWEILVKGLEQLAGVLGDQKVSVEEFSKLLTLVLSSYDVGTIPLSLDRVAAGELLRTGKRGLRWMFVLGATDESLPAVGRKTGLLTEEERDTVVSLGFGLSDTGESRLSREMYAVYAAFSLPSCGVALIWRGRGGQRPSSVVVRAKRLFSLPEESMSDEGRTLACRPCYEIAVGAELPGASPEAKAAAGWFLQQPEWSGKLRSAREAAAQRRGSLSKEAADKLYPPRMNLTASKVDRFYACRFSYFLQYGLKVKPRKPAAMDAPETGTFLHYLLEHVCSEAKDAGGFAELSDDACRELTRKYVEMYAAEHLNGLSDETERFRFLFRRLGRDAERIVLDMAEELRRADFSPTDFELEFSDSGGDLPAVRLGDEDVDVRIRGFVDRVDGWVHGGRIYLRVVDYKTGPKSFSLSDVYYGIGLQMLIYLFALQRMGQERYGMEVVPAGVLYTPARNKVVTVMPGATEEEIRAARKKTIQRSGLLLDDDAVLSAMDREGGSDFLPIRTKNGKKAESSLAKSEQFGILARHVDTLLLGMAKELRRGSIEAEPFQRDRQDSACRYCDYASVCRFQEERGDLVRRVRKLGPEEAWERMEAER